MLVPVLKLEKIKEYVGHLLDDGYALFSSTRLVKIELDDLFAYVFVLAVFLLILCFFNYREIK